MIDSLKDLEKLLNLCRKQGVMEFEHNGTKIKLGDLPAESRTFQTTELDEHDPYRNFPAGELSPTQLMFYSSGGTPEEDPELKVG